MSQLEKQRLNEKQVKIIVFFLKALEDILENYLLSGNGEQLANFTVQNINKIAELTSVACEQEDIIIRNQGQLVFQFFMNQILVLKLPLREQFEVMYVKCAIKPVIKRMKKLAELR